MPPDQPEDQPWPIEMDDHRRLAHAKLHKKSSDLAVDSSPQSSLHKHGLPEEPQSEGATKCTEVSSDTNVTDRKLVTFPQSEYNELTKCHGLLRQGFAGNTAKLYQFEASPGMQASDKEHEAANVELANMEQGQNNTNQTQADRSKKVKTEHQRQADTSYEKDAKCQTLDQDIKGERPGQDHNISELQLSELKDDATATIENMETLSQQPIPKDEIIELMMGKYRHLMHDFEVVRTQLEESKKKCLSAEHNFHNYKNNSLRLQGNLDVKAQELHRTLAKIERLQQEIVALRTVNDSNGSHNQKMSDQANTARTKLAKERKGL